jgi:hypothetical protein
MVGPGQPYEQMITGDFIAARAAVKMEEKLDESKMF